MPRIQVPPSWRYGRGKKNVPTNLMSAVEARDGFAATGGVRVAGSMAVTETADVAAFAGPTGSVAGIFPLSVHASGRYLVQANGNPFFIHGDTAWSLVGQLSNAEIDTYLNNRAAKGFNTVLFSAPEYLYTDNSPSYANEDGAVPFNPATSFTNPVAAYWNRVDYAVNAARSRGMVCIINPAYNGFSGDGGANYGDGWGNIINSLSNATLQAYGVFLANRYTQGNIIWCAGGDYAFASTITKQWNIFTGIRSVRTTDIITAHPDSSQDDPYAYWSGFTGFSLNNVYTYETAGDYVYEEAALAYGRSGPMPFIYFEGKYENSDSFTLAMLRHQSYGSILAGGCGQLYGNNPVWHFDSPNWASEPYSGTWNTHLNDTGTTQQPYVKALFAAYEWWKLQPKTDTSLVTTSLGTAGSRIYAALASDATFAMIYKPVSGSSTVSLAALSGTTSIRARYYDPTTGVYSDPTEGTTFSPSGTQAFNWPGERVLVLDQKPGQVRTSPTASRTDVLATIALCSPGDTVIVPADASESWSGGISISGITLRGAGKTTGGTVITAGLVTITKHATHNTCLRGFRFSGTDQHISIVGTPSNKPYIVHDCYFNDGAAGTIWHCSTNGGLTSKCDFFTATAHGADDIIWSMGGVGLGGEDSWEAPHTMGDADVNGLTNNYIEDCTFTNFLEVAGDIDGGARNVYRYCTFTDSSLVVHGGGSAHTAAEGGGNDTSAYGGRHLEVYGCSFNRVSNTNAINKWVWMRGATGVFANNIVMNADSPDGSSYPNKNEIRMSVACVDNDPTNRPAHPMLMQVGQSDMSRDTTPNQPYLIMGNTWAGGFTPVFGVDGDNGGGLTCAIPSTYIQAGRDYVTTNTWGWVPFTYPHPLRPSE